MTLSQSSEGTILDIRVKPRSRKFEIKPNDGFIILCREPPINGRVNRELVKELSKLFKKKVEIISGFKSKQKKILIRNSSIEEVEELFRPEV